VHNVQRKRERERFKRYKMRVINATTRIQPRNYQKLQTFNYNYTRISAVLERERERERAGCVKDVVSRLWKGVEGQQQDGSPHPLIINTVLH
jgi:spore maturation protein CgeB